MDDLTSLPAVIFIDDEDNILSAIYRLFRKEPYRIITTTDPEKVFFHLESETIALVVTDHRMPLLEGTEVLKRVKEISPDTLRIMLTGYADLESTLSAVNEGEVWRFLTKPWSDEELKNVVRSAVQHYSLQKRNKELELLTLEQNKQLKAFNTDLEEKIKERTASIITLNKQLVKTVVESIQVMGEIGAFANLESGSHAKRVAGLAEGLAKKLGFSAEGMFDLMAAGYLHDIGQIGMSKAQLRLEEQGMPPEGFDFETHPARGARLIGRISRLENAAHYILSHHERFDGNGYPDGLKGDKIPLGAQILGISNMYDEELNMIKDEAATPISVLGRIQEAAGLIFDPYLIQVLETYLQESGKLEEDQYVVEMSPFLLEDGHILAEPLISKNRAILITKDSRITSKTVTNLMKKQFIGQLPMTIRVYKQSLKKK